jgi:hypothetical protein
VSKPASGTPAPSSSVSTSSSEPQGPQQKWEVGHVGFDTEKKLWFVQLYNEVNQSVGTYMAKNVTLKHGNAAQYEWKDMQGRAFWHVRECFFADQIESIGIDPSGVNLTLHFKEDEELPLGTPKEPPAQDVPVEFHHLHYAFHLSNKEMAVGNRAPLGFVEFFDISGSLVHVINNHWIVIEGIDRKTVGEYPKIRLRIERKDVARIITTATVVIIQGKKIGG